MKINASITFLVGQNKTTIEVHDNDSSIIFLEIELTPEQLSSALSRLSMTPVKSCEVKGVDVLGKKLEVDKLEFELPSDFDKYNKSNEEELHRIALTHCKDGWIPDAYYRSQGSFFTKDGKDCARTTIRRWI